ncbi:MAG: 30S ribosomal protein S2 [Candidatus Pacebacteria bacterium CG10_big_fil_rev_8_21_14_0_10_44_11]|nr:MAG: 30S ribosomal protein S2 [Candidatus Pacebacteria bacterium CG10_big_fil_rev_8_21_14_0_10_44_11]
MNIDQLPDKAPEFDLAAMLEAGVHFGHQSAKWHPHMKEWIYMEKDGVHIFDLAKTAEQLKKAYNVAYELGKSGKTLVVVGTKRQVKDIILDAAQANKVPYIVSRWLGGLMTNWDQVKKSLKRMIEIEEGLKTDKYAKYTKYERLQLEKEKIRLERFFGGIKDLKSAPDALFVVDTQREANAIKEANTLGVFTIGLVDTNSNPDMVDLVIPGNDDGRKSLEFIINAVLKGYSDGKTA